MSHQKIAENASAVQLIEAEKGAWEKSADLSEAIELNTWKTITAIATIAGLSTGGVGLMVAACGVGIYGWMTHEMAVRRTELQTATNRSAAYAQNQNRDLGKKASYIKNLLKASSPFY